MRRRAVLVTLALTSLALGPVIYAAATPARPTSAGPSLTGTITRVDLAHHRLVVKVTAARGPGAAGYKGKAVPLVLKISPPGATSVVRLGHKGKLSGLKKDDRVVVTYKLNAAKKLVAVTVTDSGPAPVTTPTPSPTPSPTPAPTETPTSTTPYSAPPPPPTSSIPANAFRIHMFSYGYTLDPGHPKVGQVVAVIADASNHSWTSGTGPNGDGMFDSGFVSSGANYQYSFGSAGTYTFFCKNHWSTHKMTGTITVDPA